MASEEDEEKDIELAQQLASFLSPEVQKKRLLTFLRSKDASFGVRPESEDIDDARRGIVDKVYDTYYAVKAKMEAAFPGEKIAGLVWSTRTLNNEPIAYASYDGNDTGGEAIYINPEAITLDPKVLGGVIGHEGGHDVIARGFLTYETDRQQECFSDHAAQYSGQGDDAIAALKYVKAQNPHIADKVMRVHPSLNQRITALEDQTFADVSPFSLTFDEECHMTLKTPSIPSPPSKPRQK